MGKQKLLAEPPEGLSREVLEYVHVHENSWDEKLL